MSNALTVLRQELLRQLGLGKIIPNAYFDAAAAGSITSSNVLRDSNVGGGQYQGWTIFRPTAATAADYIRVAGQLTVATGLLAHTGANYADTTVTSEIPELWKYGVRPDLEIIDSLNRCLEFEYISSRFAISHLSGLDGDMALSTEANWTDIPAVTTTKGTSAGVTPEGMRSYRALNSGANGGTRSASYRVRQSGTVNAFAIAASEVGTSSLQPYDNTNSVVFGNVTAVTSSEREPQLLVIQNGAVPSTCKLASLNLTNTSATGDSYWNQAWLYDMDDLTCLLPAPVVEGFMAPTIAQARPTIPTGQGTYSARSFDYVALTEGRDYFLSINHADAEAYKVRFANPMPTTGGHPYQWPLMVETRRPQSDLVTMAADETAVVNVAKHNLLPRWKIDVLQTIYNGAAYPKHPDWDNQMKLATDQLIKATQARPIASVALQRAYNPGFTRL